MPDTDIRNCLFQFEKKKEFQIFIIFFGKKYLNDEDVTRCQENRILIFMPSDMFLPFLQIEKDHSLYLYLAFRVTFK